MTFKLFKTKKVVTHLAESGPIWTNPDYFLAFLQNAVPIGLGPNLTYSPNSRNKWSNYILSWSNQDAFGIIGTNFNRWEQFGPIRIYLNQSGPIWSNLGTIYTNQDQS